MIDLFRGIGEEENQFIRIPLHAAEMAAMEAEAAGTLDRFGI